VPARCAHSFPGDGSDLANVSRRFIAMTDRKLRLDAVAAGTLVFCCAVWGLGQVASKVALVEIPPFMQVAARSLGAALLVALWAGARGIRLTGRDGTLAAGLLCGVLFAIEFGCIFVGLKYTTASRMVVFVYLSPFVVALGMPLIARSERLDALQALGLIAAFAGVAWAFAEGFQKPSAGDRQWLGDALGVGGAVFWGATTLVIRGSRLSQAAPEKTLLYQLVLAALLLGLASWLVGEPWPTGLNLIPLLSLGFQTLVVCFASYLLWFWLVRHYPATLLSAFTLLTPVFGLMAGVALLGEPMTLRLLLALAAVAVGIVLVSRVKRVHAASPARRNEVPDST
jgi:drug/metabolite transporter (DMT)-like permease